MSRVHWSRLKEMARSPAHYRWALEHPREEMPPLRFGLATHCLTLEPQVFDARFTVFEGDRRTKAWKEFQAANAGRTILSADEAAEARAVAEAVRAHPIAADLLSQGEAEQPLEWTHRANVLGEWYEIDCGGRFDFYGRGRLVELKTTRDASLEGFPREAAKYDYHGQLAFYRDGLVAFGRPVAEVWVIAAETAPPYGVSVWQVPKAVIDAGRERYFLLLDRLHRCQAADAWPCWPEAQTLTLPYWKTNETCED